jgi:predicted deacylase
VLRAGKLQKHRLPAWGAGSSTDIFSVHFHGSENNRKVYIQGGLHADEAPGYLVAVKLIEMLDEAARLGQLREQVVIVPAANPIGLTQWTMETIQGRFDLADNVNFNRNFPELVENIADRIGSHLTDDEKANVQLIRHVAREVLAGQTAVSPGSAMKLQLLRLSHDADLVLDLHCDFEAVLHVYMGTPHWPEWSDLSAQLGAETTLLATDSGDNPFDEANSKLWWQLAEYFPNYPIPPACMAATVELRGEADTDGRHTTADAANLFSFLQRRGIITGDPPALPPLLAEATPLAGVEYVRADRPGVLSFLKPVGSRVVRGEPLAILTSPTNWENGDRRVDVTSSIDGVLFARSLDRFARPGKVVAKVAGKTILAGKGPNLLTV